MLRLQPRFQSTTSQLALKIFGLLKGIMLDGTFHLLMNGFRACKNEPIKCATSRNMVQGFMQITASLFFSQLTKTPVEDKKADFSASGRPPSRSHCAFSKWCHKLFSHPTYHTQPFGSRFTSDLFVCHCKPLSFVTRHAVLSHVFLYCRRVLHEQANYFVPKWQLLWVFAQTLRWELVGVPSIHNKLRRIWTQLH